MLDLDLFERWILTDTARTYHEWVAWYAASLEAWAEYDARKAALVLRQQEAVRQREALEREAREAARAQRVQMIEERIAQIPAQYRNDDTDSFLIGEVWRTRTDVLEHPPEWWFNPSAPTILTLDELRRFTGYGYAHSGIIHNWQYQDALTLASGYGYYGH
jgi:hypothetical protein